MTAPETVAMQSESNAVSVGSLALFGLTWDRPKQLKLKENGECGDCWRCCIACILQIAPAEVPHFVEDYKSHAFVESAKWLRQRGIWLIEGQSLKHPDWDCPEVEELPIIATGPSCRSKGMGQHHAVVTINGDVVYDPHPSNAGLTAICHQYALVGMYRPNSDYAS